MVACQRIWCQAYTLILIRLLVISEGHHDQGESFQRMLRVTQDIVYIVNATVPAVDGLGSHAFTCRTGFGLIQVAASLFCMS